MKKIVFLLLIALCIIQPCHATDHTGNNLLSMIGLTPETATRNSVTALMGEPHRVQENKKSTSWFYTLGSTQVVINWSKKTESLLRFSFKTILDAKSAFDNSLPYQLKSGTTNLTEALNILGTPQDAVSNSLCGSRYSIPHVVKCGVLPLATSLTDVIGVNSA